MKRITYICPARVNPWPIVARRMVPWSQRMNEARVPRLNKLSLGWRLRSLACDQRLTVGLDGYEGWLS